MVFLYKLFLFIRDIESEKKRCAGTFSFLFITEKAKDAIIRPPSTFTKWFCGEALNCIAGIV
ncbi:hypothetical protein BLX87_14875 [Bacillus sp. VT-16-64]|nr:hypothetical protein BLX87_14875 [Bacillus sp. VT-16-64]